MPPKPRRKRTSKKGSGNANAAARQARDAARIAAKQLVASGNALLDAGDYDGAIADFECAIAADRAFALSRRNRGKIASAYASRGNAKTHAGDYAGAQADYERASELARDLPAAPVTPEAAELVICGNAKEEQGDYDGAIADYDRAIAINPHIAAAYYIRGNAKAGKSDYGGAIADYDRVIAITPRFYWSSLQPWPFQSAQGRL